MLSLNSVNGARLAGWIPRFCAHAIDTWILPVILLINVVPSLLQACLRYLKDWIQFQSTSTVTFGRFHTQPPVFNGDGIVAPWMWLLVIGWLTFTLFNGVVWQGLSGHTVGKRLLRLRTVHGDHGRPPGIPRSAWRWILQRVNIFFPGALFVPLADPFRRSIADKFANTIVVVDRRGLPRDRSSWRGQAPSRQTVDLRDYPAPDTRPIDARRDSRNQHRA